MGKSSSQLKKEEENRKVQNQQNNLVAQQKLMLKQQQKAINDRSHSTNQNTGEDMGALFKKKKDESAKATKLHVKSKSERENEELVAQQKRMLKQQQKAIKDSADRKAELGESSQSKDAGGIAILFDNTKDAKAKKAQTKKPTAPQMSKAMKQAIDAQKAILKQTKNATPESKKGRKGDAAVASLFTDKDDKKKSKAKVVKSSSQLKKEREMVNIVAQQKLMLKQQQKAINDRSHSTNQTLVRIWGPSSKRRKMHQQRPQSSTSSQRASVRTRNWWHSRSAC